MKSVLDIYRENFLREPVEVMGLRMVPFTIGHAVTIDRLGITKAEAPEDLLVSAVVCSMPVKVFERKLQTRRFSLWFLWWSWRTSCRWLKETGSFARSMELFNSYLDEQTTCPDYDLIRKAEEIEGGVPFIQHLRAVLLSKLDYSPETVMETSFTQAYWDYCSHLENERAIEVLDGRRGDNAKARFDEADARHEELIKRVMEQRAQAGQVNGNH